MREQLEERLQQLRNEFEIGQNKMTELERQQANLQRTLLRISGAIQVLEELLKQDLTPFNIETAETMTAVTA
jgi:predicted nuclease with TOPRIM domain